uniref:discoidin domain-containing protein n=1 Tax=Rubrolithibacter danxiaensis TaxID=3390805 RepID=UPI003BF91618
MAPLHIFQIDKIKKTLPVLLICLFGFFQFAQAQFPYGETYKRSTAPGTVYGQSAALTGGTIDPGTDGYLRLTSNAGYQKGYAYSDAKFPSAHGIKANFEYFTYGGTGADGFTFFLFDASITAFDQGAYGGSLGYAQSSNPPTLGMNGGFLGVGFDEYGNYGVGTEGKGAGSNSFSTTTGTVANSIVIRGQDDGSRGGYPFIAGVHTSSGTYTPRLASADRFPISGGTARVTNPTQAGYRKVYVDIVPNSIPNPTSFTITVQVYVGELGRIITVINGATYAPTSIPTYLKAGFAASTGGSTNYHEIRGMDVNYSDGTGLTNPTATNDDVIVFKDITAIIDVFNNDVLSNEPKDYNRSSIDLDPGTAGQQTSLLVPGKGTFSVSSDFYSDGKVTFVPVSGFTGTASVSYNYKDNYGFQSNTATLTVTVDTGTAPDMSITAPATTSFCAGNGNPAAITGNSVTGYTLQWQSSTDGTTFTNISGATSANYNPGTLTSTTYYRRVATSTTAGGTIYYSNTVAVTVQPTITTNTLKSFDDVATGTAPVSITVRTGSTPGALGTNVLTGTTAQKAGYTYQWQYFTNAGVVTPTEAMWQNITSAYGTTNSTGEYLYPASQTTAQYIYYRRIVNAGTCADASTNYIRIRFLNSNRTNVIGTDAVYCTGSDPVTLTNIANSAGTTYEWQRSTDNINWTTGIGTGQTFNPPVITATTYYRRKIESTPESYSNVVTLWVAQLPTVTSQPSNQAICSGSNTTFSVTASATDDPPFSYQWQVSTDGGSTFSDIANGGVYSTATTSTLTITGATVGMNTYQYRCVVSVKSGTTACTSSASNAATLTVNTGATLNSSPSNTSVCPATTATFTVGASGLGVSYQWQYRTSSSGTWADLSNDATYSGVTTSSLKVVASAAISGYQYRALIANQCTPSTASSVATLTVYAAIGNNIITTAAASYNCAGTPFFINAGYPTGGPSGTYTFQWQSSTDNVTWSNISGATSQGYGPPEFSATTYFRRIVYSGTCSDVSSPVTFTINTTGITNNTISATGSVTSCASFNPGQLQGTYPAGSGSSTYSFQWQISTDNVTFTNIGGATAQNYSPGTVTATRYFRRLVTSGGCSNYSNVLTITVGSVPSSALAITGSNLVCAPSTGQAYSISAITGATSYSWSYSGTGATITGGTTRSITVNFSSTATSGNLVVTVNSSCGTSTNSLALTVNPVPALTSGLTPSAICSESAFAYTPTSNATSSTNLALNKFATASSYENITTMPASYAIDGNSTGTRWSSAFSDPQYITVDLGASYNVNQVKITWENAYGKDFKIQVSDDNLTWTDLKVVTGNTLLANDYTGLSGSGRYVRMYGTARGTGYGFSMYEFEVYGTPVVTYSWSRAAVTGISNSAVTGTGSVNETLTNTTTSPVNVVYAYTITANGCSNTQNVTVTVNPKPNVSNQTAATCSGAAFTVTPTGVPAGTTYTWSAPVVTGGLTGGSAQATGVTSISQTLTNPTTSVQTATYTVTPTSGSCVGNTFTVTITVNPKPSVTSQTATICSGSSFTVTPSGVPAGTTYTWSAPLVTGGLTGGSAQATGVSSISQTLTNPTTSVQTATYTVTPAAGGCTGNTFTVTVTVNPSAVITLTSAAGTTAQTLCINTPITPITYSVTGGGTGAGVTGLPAGVTGNFSGGVFSISGTPTTSGTFNYTVTTTGTCTQTTATGTIIVNPLPVITTQPSDITVCEGGNGSSTVSATGTGLTYQWQAFSGGSWINVPAMTGVSGATSSTISGSNVPLAYNGYQFRVIVTSNGCSVVSNAVTLNVNQTPTIANAGSDQAINKSTATATVTLNANSPTVGTGIWAKISGPASFTITNATLNNTTVTGLTSGTYVFQWSISNGSCTSSIDQVQISINTIPVATPQSITTAEDTPKSGSLSGTDAEGSTLTYAKGTDPAHGSVTINATTGAYTYT